MPEHVESGFGQRVTLIWFGEQRPVEEHLLAFRNRDSVPLPVLEEISFVPVEACAPYKALKNVVRHVYMLSIYIRPHLGKD